MAAKQRREKEDKEREAAAAAAEAVAAVEAGELIPEGLTVPTPPPTRHVYDMSHFCFTSCVTSQEVSHFWRVRDLLRGAGQIMASGERETITGL